MNRLFPIIILVLLTGCNSGKSDSSLAKKIAGAWDERHTSKEGATIEAHTVYVPSGLLTISGALTVQGQSFQIVASGSWHVKDGYLHYTIQRSNIPEVIPNGFKAADKITSVDGKEFVYVDSLSGETVVACRGK